MGIERLISGTISASKSSSADARRASKSLMKAILSSLRRFLPGSEQVLSTAVQQVLALPVGGKTTSADNRICLLEMLDTDLPPRIAGDIIKGLAPLTAKETNEAALTAMMDTISTHLSCCLQSDIEVLDTKTIQALTKDLSSNKTITRRLFFSRICDSLWASGRSDQGWSSDGWKLAEACLPAFESTLKTASAAGTASASAASGTPIEAYMVVAITLDPMQRSESKNAVDKYLNTNTAVQSLGILKPKPSFLLTERIYRRTITDNVDPIAARQGREWMLRAFEALLSRSKKGKSEEASRLAAAVAVVQTSFEAPDRDSRTEGVSTLNRVATKAGWTSSELFVHALESQIRHFKPSATETESTAEVSKAAGQVAYSLLIAISQQSARVDSSEKAADGAASFVEQALVLSHHQLIATAVADAWINLAVTLGVALDSFAAARQDSIMRKIRLEESVSRS